MGHFAQEGFQEISRYGLPHSARALCHAVVEGNAKACVEALLLGADPAVMVNGETALEIAVDCGEEEILDLLLSRCNNRLAMQVAKHVAEGLSRQNCVAQIQQRLQ